MFTEKNVITTNWNTLYGVIGNHFPMISEGTFEFPAGSGSIVSVLSKLPTTLFSVKGDPSGANVYLNTGLQTTGMDSKKLIDLAEQIHKKENLSEDDDYNISVDYETGTLFSYGQKTKQYLGRDWKKYLHPIDVHVTEFVPGASYILLEHNNRLLVNSKSFARDFTFLLSLSVLDFMYDNILEQQPEKFYSESAIYSYVTPSSSLTFLVCQWLLQVLAARKLGITWMMNTDDFNYLYKVYKPIIPMFPDHVFTEEALNVASLFKFPHYFNNSKLVGQLKLLPKEEVKPVKPEHKGSSLIEILSKSDKPEEGSSVSFYNIKMDVPGVSAYISEEDIIDMYVKSNAASFHIYIIVEDGCPGLKHPNGHEYVEKRIETLCNFHFKEVDRQKMYVYLVSNTDYISNKIYSE